LWGRALPHWSGATESVAADARRAGDKENGFRASERGRAPADVREAYEKDH
jgi:hypothetical protein